jgi:hypothetical protein
MVGIDSEWKPYFGTRRNELALIQIATRERVYILDVCNLGSECPKLWRDLGLMLFANENIIKLGKLTFLYSRLVTLYNTDFVHSVELGDSCVFLCENCKNSIKKFCHT